MVCLSGEGVASIGWNHLTAPVWNVAHQLPQLVPVEVVPFLLDSDRTRAGCLELVDTH